MAPLKRLAAPVASLAVLATILPMSARADVADGPRHVRRTFDIVRAGSPIGTDTFDVVRDGTTTKVTITTHIAVKIAFITAYRYDHSESETWTGNQLVAFRSATNDNGKPHTIEASASAGKVSLVVDGAASTAPKAIMPASVWTADIAKHPQLFDPGTGKRLTAKGENLGDEAVVMNGAPRQLEHVKLSGQFDRDLWFDDQGLVKMTLRGTDNSLITSQLRQSTAAR